MRKKCCVWQVIGLVLALAGIAAAVVMFLKRHCDTPAEDAGEEDLVEYLTDNEDADREVQEIAADSDD